MSIKNSILAYTILAGVTLGLMNVPHAIFYEHPHLIFSRWHREDLL